MKLQMSVKLKKAHKLIAHHLFQKDVHHAFKILQHYFEKKSQSIKTLFVAHLIYV